MTNDTQPSVKFEGEVDIKRRSTPMTNDKPPVAPKEGFYAMLRNGMIARPIIDDHAWLRQGLKQNVDPYLELVWFDDGRCHSSSGLEEFTDQYDIIATISPSMMQFAQNSTKYINESIETKDRLAELTALASAVLDHADQHCRAFPIATFPRERWFEAWNKETNSWQSIFLRQDTGMGVPAPCFTHWREPPPPPPPTNPPLPAVFTELGAALEKIKGAG